MGWVVAVFLKCVVSSSAMSSLKVMTSGLTMKAGRGCGVCS
jgi:hypothetical protein